MKIFRDTQLSWLQAEVMSCSVHLDIAKNAGDRSYRQRALDNAVVAYTSVRAHLPQAQLTDKERNSLERWANQVRRKLQDLLTA